MEFTSTQVAMAIDEIGVSLVISEAEQPDWTDKEKLATFHNRCNGAYTVLTTLADNPLEVERWCTEELQKLYRFYILGEKEAYEL